MYAMRKVFIWHILEYLKFQWDAVLNVYMRT